MFHSKHANEELLLLVQVAGVKNQTVQAQSLLGARWRRVLARLISVRRYCPRAKLVRRRQLGIVLACDIQSTSGVGPRRLAQSNRKQQAPQCRRASLWRMRSNTARPSPLVTIASPSIRNDCAGRAVTAATMTGKRLVKSFPWRVISRTPALSRRAMMRKPSCLISCSQPGPEGGAFAGDGRHGSIIPTPGRGTLTQRH